MCIAFKMKAFIIRSLFDSVRFAGGTRFIAFNIMACNKNTVAGDYFSGFYKSNISNYNILKNNARLGDNEIVGRRSGL